MVLTALRAFSLSEAGGEYEKSGSRIINPKPFFVYFCGVVFTNYRK